MHKKLEEFEGLRAVLSIWVVVYHVFTISGFNVPEYVNGSNAVSVFFVLSGFVIAMLFDTKKETCGAFIVRRFFRIFPAYAICVSISLILVLFGFMPKTYEDGSIYSHLLLHAFMLHGVLPIDWLPGADSAFLNPAWSITVEWQFYLLIPIFFILLRTRPILAWVSIIVLAAISRKILWPLFEMGGGSLLAYLHFFVYGVISFFVYQWVRKNTEILGAIAKLFPIIFPLSILPMAAIIPNIGLLIWLVFFGAALSVRVGSSLKSTNMLIAMLSSRPFTWLGAISYALYLVHEPVVWISLHGIHYVFPNLDKMISLILVGAVSIPASIGIAYLLHIAIELPCIRAGKLCVERPFFKASAVEERE